MSELIKVIKVTFFHVDPAQGSKIDRKEIVLQNQI